MGIPDELCCRAKVAEYSSGSALPASVLQSRHIVSRGQGSQARQRRSISLVPEGRRGQRQQCTDKSRIHVTTWGWGVPTTLRLLRSGIAICSSLILAIQCVQ